MNNGLILILLVIMTFYILFTVLGIESRLKRLEHSIEQIGKKAGAYLEGPIDEELRDLLKAEKDIEAIKRAREEMGLSLVEAKEYIDELKKYI